MSKGPIFIFASSVIILVSFGALCYLMTIVNPKPLQISPDETRRYSSVDTLYVNDVFLPSDNIDYGLEKVPEKYADVINITDNPISRGRYDHGPSGDIDRRVMPPVWPRMNFTEIIKNCTRRGNDSYSFFPIKGHRRSIKDETDPSNHIKGPRSLILKIIDDDGIQRIEIKMGSKPIRKKARKHRSYSSKIKGRYSKNNTSTLDEKYTDNRVVILKSNDTIVLNIIGDSILLSGANKVETMIAEDGLDPDNSTKYYNHNVTISDDNTESHMVDLLETDFNEKGINISNAWNDSNSISTEIMDFTANESLKSINGEADVTSNSAVDLLILEDSLREALISENDPFDLNENIFNKTD